MTTPIDIARMTSTSSEPTSQSSHGWSKLSHFVHLHGVHRGPTKNLASSSLAIPHEVLQGSEGRWTWTGRSEGGAHVDPEAVRRAHAARIFPLMDVVDTTDTITAVVDCAGLGPENVSVSLTSFGHLITVSGAATADISTVPAESKVWESLERHTGPFERTFSLGHEIDPATIQATVKNGLLKIVVPKPKQDATVYLRKIPVTVSDGA